MNDFTAKLMQWLKIRSAVYSAALVSPGLRPPP